MLAMFFVYKEEEKYNHILSLINRDIKNEKGL
jgi:hypothetical protein